MSLNVRLMSGSTGVYIEELPLMQVSCSACGWYLLWRGLCIIKGDNIESAMMCHTPEGVNDPCLGIGVLLQF